MRYAQTGYMHLMTENDWNKVLRDLPRERHETALYDLTYSSGVMSGCEVVQAAVPNLTVTVRKGRALVRDELTRKAKAIEMVSDTSFDLSSFLPAGSATNVYIVARPNTTTTTPVTITNAAPTLSDGSLSESYDAAFSSTTIDTIVQDSFTLAVTGSPNSSEVILAKVTLSSGMTAILQSHISLDERQLATVKPLIDKLISRIDALEAYSVPVGGVIDFLGDALNVPVGFLIPQGQKLLQAAYPKLFALLGLRFSTVNQNPATDVDPLTEFRLPRLTDRVTVAAGGAYSLGQTGGNAETTLGIANLPAHAHDISVNGVPDHTHGATIAQDGIHRHGFRGSFGGNANSDNPIIADTTGNFEEPENPDFGVLEGGAHSHAATINAAGGHSHGASSSSVGSGQAFSNMPPFIGALKIMRVQ